ncbi:MAG: 5-amino-6-(D-ribitylamino)uracil--L-tyrosine 4-hydroxyphenyl transferase CofH [Hyphomicrobiaceae bacterium]|nr:5-amino-6-(D-ribitylamino)uracil--L-tyrosine 4-hydroxyphenyl transferase CofH [Hyphomicrobiaceae bacterium]
MSGIVAVVPMKPLSAAKSRLARDMPEAQRCGLVRDMLVQVLTALRDAGTVEQAFVLTADPELADLAASCGAGHIREPQVNGLNAAVRTAAGYAENLGAEAMLVLPGDIPLVTGAEIDAFTSCLQGAGVAIVPAHDRDGTNALLLAPPRVVSPAFGDRSFERHRQAAKQSGLEPAIFEGEGISRDIDDVSDLAWLAKQGPDWPETAWLPSHVSDVDAVTVEQALALADCNDLERLCERAEELTLAGYGELVSFSKKVFIPLTKLCRDVCHYCTFAQTPRKIGHAYLSPDEVVDIARAGAAAGCREALFTLGDKPELRYRAAREALAEFGHDSTLSYLEETARLVLEVTGLLPHLNPGVMDEHWLARLKAVSISQGIMLESVSARLMQKRMAHHGSPDKDPHVRLATLEAAGKAGVPFTTGLLIGIGETRLERIEALLAIRACHERHGHIQEIIIQNFRAKPGTRMAQAPEPSLEDHVWTIAVARLIFGSRMNIQAPPNLRPGALVQLVRAGINDWGGVSPVTPDHVNPEAPWPHLDRLAEETDRSGRCLTERLALYPEYVRKADRWVAPELGPALLKHSDAQGYAREDDWFAGAETPLPLHKHGSPALNLRHRSVSRAVESIAGGRLDEKSIARLFSSRGGAFDEVVSVADARRRERKGDCVTYVVNRNINYTNLCTYGCRFCAFSKGRLSQGHRDKPYDLSLEEIARRTSEAWSRGATEVCLQGGIGARYSGDTYLAIVRAVKAAAPDIHVHAFSPLEITHGAETLGLPLDNYLARLRDAGLSSLPGTAAEILDDEVRAILCADKVDTAQWLRVMEVAHGVGLRSTATIMFGHVDGYRHWARHLLRVRALQEKTGGFTEFVPLPFVHMEAPIYLKGEARRGPTWREAVLMHAVSRLVLDPVITNIQSSWVKLGAEGAARCLSAGVNDLGGSLMNESITRAAGAVHGQEMTPDRMTAIIHEADRMPVQRNTLYGRVEDPNTVEFEPDVLPVSLRLVAAE